MNKEVENYIEKQKYGHKNIKDIERGNYYLERR